MKPERKIALVLLAAGESRRFHGNKLLAELDGKPMYRHIADELETLPQGVFFRRLVVSRYRTILDDLSALGYEAVENCHSDWGVSYSIRLALTALEQGDAADAVCFAVCDQPWLTAVTVRRFLLAWQEDGRGLGCLSFRGRGGNPAVFSRRYLPELMELSGDTGGRAVLRRHPQDVYHYEISEERELWDVDTPFPERSPGDDPSSAFRSSMPE